MSAAQTTTAGDTPATTATVHGARATKFLQGIWKRVKPMTHTNDLLLVIDSSRNLMWFSHHDQRILATDIHTEAKLQAALESCLPPNESLTEYMWKILSRFEDAGAPLNPGSFSFGGLEYQSRGHCLLNSGHRLIALVFSPVGEGDEMALDYSDESSSSLNRMSDLDARRDSAFGHGYGANLGAQSTLAGSYGTMGRVSPAPGSAVGSGDYFPGASHPEVGYYYSLLPRSEEGHFKDVDRNGKLPKSASCAVDIEVEDPDETVPVVQPTARQFSTAPGEGAGGELKPRPAVSVLGARKPTSTVSPGHSCQECGTTQSPEWRKGPNGSKTLCNACGLRYAKRLRQR